MYHIPSLVGRINTIILASACALTVIIIRLFYLQIICTAHYVDQGTKNFLRTETVRSARGNILDRHGNLLVTNRPAIHLCWHGTGNRTLSDEQQDTLLVLEQIVGHSILENPQLHTAIESAEKRCHDIPIVHDMNHEQLSQLEEIFPHNENLSFINDFERHYPYGSYASHILGYLGRNPALLLYGQTGLEKLYEATLQGQDGVIARTINAAGKNIDTQELQEAIHGGNIQTTLDLELQSIAEQIFPSAYCGTLIMMDPEQGDILALVSRPSFDPTVFLKPIAHTDWLRLQADNPFLNRALNPYPPGSIFKLVTISAALESKIVNKETIWHCEGYIDFAGRKYWCHNRDGHGALNLMQAVAYSCNTLFYELGKQIDIDVLAQYASLFGLGQPTGIIFPERTGIIPSRSWKLKTKGELWWPGETLSVTIGQSFLLVSPLQIARMIGGIFTGNLVKPRIVLQESIVQIPLALNKETIVILKEAMQFVVQKGTGKRVNITDMDIHAKTSTAQTTDFKRRAFSNLFLEHAWFVAHVQYKNEKPFILLLLLENVGSSKVAALVAKEFLLAYKKAINKKE